HKRAGELHAIFRDGSRLVGADHCGAAEGFYGGDSFYNDPALRQPPCAQCHERSERYGYLFRQDAHGQGEGLQEAVHQVPRVEEIDGPDDEENDNAGKRHLLYKGIDLTLQGCALAFYRFAALSDPAQPRVYSDFCNAANGKSSNYSRALVYFVVIVRPIFAYGK